MSTTIISNCPLCENHSLHLIGKDEYMMQQCIYCGYVSFEKFIFLDIGAMPPNPLERQPKKIINGLDLKPGKKKVNF